MAADSVWTHRFAIEVNGARATLRNAATKLWFQLGQCAKHPKGSIGRTLPDKPGIINLANRSHNECRIYNWNWIEAAECTGWFNRKSSRNIRFGISQQWMMKVNCFRQIKSNLIKHDTTNGQGTLKNRQTQQVQTAECMIPIWSQRYGSLDHSWIPNQQHGTHEEIPFWTRPAWARKCKAEGSGQFIQLNPFQAMSINQFVHSCLVSVRQPAVPMRTMVLPLQ